MIRGMIFDLDGTLLDTIADLATASNAVMEEYDFPTFTDEEIKMKVGNGNRLLMERCLPDDKKDLTEEALERFKKAYSKCCLDKTRPYEGMYETVKELYDRGILLAVNTNKINDYCEKLIHKNFPGIEFVKILGNIEGIPTKPDPTGVEEILKLMKLPKEEVLYIGDSDVDIKTAKNAGLQSVWVPWGFRSYEQVKEWGPDHILEKAEDLLKLL